MATTSSGPAFSAEKVRSPAHEEELDRKIQEIQRNNRLIEERQKVRQVEARESGVPKSITEPFTKADGGRLISSDSAAHQERPRGGTRNRNGRRNSNKAQPPAVEAPQWSREWDAGKLPAEQWKMNVPEVEEPNRNGHRARGPRKSMGGGGENSVARHPPNRSFRPSRGVRGAAQNSQKEDASPRNPGFFHDERGVPAGGAETQPNGVHKDNVENGGAQNGKRTWGGGRRAAREPRKNVPEAAQNGGENNNGGDPNAELGVRKTTRGGRGGARKKQTAGQVAGEESRKEDGDALTGERRRGGRNRPRFGGGARRTSATNASGADALENNENALTDGKHEKARRNRNRSITRVVVRSVLYSVVKQVCIEAGDFTPKNFASVGDALARKAPRRERGGARKNHPRNDNNNKNDANENTAKNDASPTQNGNEADIKKDLNETDIKKESNETVIKPESDKADNDKAKVVDKLNDINQGGKNTNSPNQTETKAKPADETKNTKNGATSAQDPPPKSADNPSTESEV